MLIIFDLDDTLVETSKCLTPFRLRQALQAMIEAGLEVDSFERALSHLLEVNRTASTSRKALEVVATLYPNGSQALDAGLACFSLPFPEETFLTAAEGALSLLEELAQDHTLALVTMGVQAVQFQKMEKAGIQPKLFSKIIVSGGPSKRPSYEEVMRQFPHAPGLVCGDRVFLDLSPAKELGLKTVHVRAGRGLEQAQPACDIDFSISRLAELKEILPLVDL